MSKTFSELDRAVSLNNGDLLALAQVDAEAETGYKSAAAPVSDVAQKILKEISFPADLETDSKTVLGAINEAAMDKNIANPYSNQATYDVGDFVIYRTVLYKCTTAVSVAEDFDSTKWTQAKVSDLVGADVSEQISDLSNTINDITSHSKNLFDKDHANVIDAVPDGVTSKYKSSSYGKTVWIKCKPNTTYTASKILTSRFAISYGEEEPAVGAALDHYISNASRTALTITTNGTAKYLAVYLYFSSLDTEYTLTEVLATLQIEVGDEATSYVPFLFTAKDSVARTEIDEINNTLDNFGKEVIVNSTRQNATYGSELINDFSSMTAIGDSTFADGKWTIPNESGISTSLSVEANTTYLIQLDVSSSTSTDGSGNHKVNPLLISLGDDDIEIFANPDANWKVCLTPITGGSVTFAIECEEALSIVLAGVSVKPIILFPTAPIIANGKPLFATNTSGYSFAFGGGQAKRANGTMNTAFGYDSQKKLDTGYADTAFGHNAQRDIRNGRGNCAFGHRAQEAITTGMYNNAVGTVAQGSITSGCWNNALGNEAQRDLTTGCDNTSIGRRAHSYITSGNLNTAVGAQAGFATKTHQDGSWATKTANYQTLVGAEACQNSAAQSDYLTALGYRAVGGEKALALGANSSANGVKSVAIGYGVTADNDGDVVIGDADSNIFLGDKELGVDIYTASQVDKIVSDAIYGILPSELTPTGAVANFGTTLELPIVDISVNNSATKIYQFGSNLWNGAWEQGTYDTTTGEKAESTTLKRNIKPIPVKENTAYTRVKTQEGALLACRLFFYDADMNLLATEVNTSNIYSFTTPVGCSFLNFAFQNNITALSLNYPDTDHSLNTYNPASGEYPIAEKDNIIPFAGVNNIFTDSGDIAVEYKVSIEQYVSNHSGSGLGGGLLGGSFLGGNPNPDESESEGGE